MFVAVLALSAVLTGCCAPAESPESDTAPRQPPVPVQAAPVPQATTDAPAGDGWTVIGTSVQGRPIRARTLGSGARKVLFLGGIHGDEPEGAYTAAELPAAFAAAGLADTVTLTLIEDVNPDGRAGGTRDNANGVDVNRNFPATNFDSSDPTHGGTPLSQPEARALYDTIERIDPDLVLSMHSWVNREFVNFDGPARGLAERFAAASGLPVEESGAFAPTPGSLGSYVGRDRGTPILTIEVRKGSDPQQVWEGIRAAVLDVIGG